MVVTGFSLIFLYIGIKAEFHKAFSFVVLFYSFMIFPVLNPCISLCFIVTYRKSFVDFIRWILRLEMRYGGWRQPATLSSIASALTPDNRSVADGHSQTIQPVLKVVGTSRTTTSQSCRHASRMEEVQRF